MEYETILYIYESSARELIWNFIWNHWILLESNLSNIENGDPFRIEFLTWPACPSMLQWRSLDSVTVKVFPWCHHDVIGLPVALVVHETERCNTDTYVFFFMDFLWICRGNHQISNFFQLAQCFALDRSRVPRDLSAGIAGDLADPGSWWMCFACPGW